jgi:hypothetical protein
MICYDEDTDGTLTTGWCFLSRIDCRKLVFSWVKCHHRGMTFRFANRRCNCLVLHHSLILELRARVFLWIERASAGKPTGIVNCDRTRVFVTTHVANRPRCGADETHPLVPSLLVLTVGFPRF